MVSSESEPVGDVSNPVSVEEGLPLGRNGVCGVADHHRAVLGLA
jgi:hypothetical protein